MSIRTKGRRRITVEDQDYIWYVAPDDESPYDILHIVSDDKCLILACPLRTVTDYVISKGRLFRTKSTDGTWNRYLLPFPVPEIVTPKFVAEVIRWATKDEPATAVQWDGHGIPV